MRHSGFLGWSTLKYDLVSLPFLPRLERNLLTLGWFQIKKVFGAFDLISAALLCLSSTRKLGLTLAVIGFAGGLYGELRRLIDHLIWLVSTNFATSMLQDNSM